MREFDTGATRDTDDNKLDYEGFLSPLVLERYARYMQKNRVQADGKLRDSDNWQKGIPMSAYMKSAWRHFFEWWSLYRTPVETQVTADQMLDATCALLFNVMGYIHEFEKFRREDGELFGYTLEQERLIKPGQGIPVDDINMLGTRPEEVAAYQAEMWRKHGPASSNSS